MADLTNMDETQPKIDHSGYSHNSSMSYQEMLSDSEIEEMLVRMKSLAYTYLSDIASSEGDSPRTPELNNDEPTTSKGQTETREVPVENKKRFRRQLRNRSASEGDDVVRSTERARRARQGMRNLKKSVKLTRSTHAIRSVRFPRMLGFAGNLGNAPMTRRASRVNPARMGRWIKSSLFDSGIENAQSNSRSVLNAICPMEIPKFTQIKTLTGISVPQQQFEHFY